jgi:hypothetical protein
MSQNVLTADINILIMIKDVLNSEPPHMLQEGYVDPTMV